MSNDLQQRIRDLRTKEQAIVPASAWKDATRATLLMQVRNTMPPAKQMSIFRSVRDLFRYVIPREISLFVRRPAMALLSLIILTMGGSIMSVSAAEQAQPGDFLYGLKLASEQAQIALTATKEDRLKLKTEFTTRRVSELKNIVGTSDQSDQQDRVVEMAETLKRDLSTIKDQLSDVANESSSDKVAEAAKLVDQKSLEVITALQEAKTSLPPESQERVTEAQSVASDAGVKAIEVLAQTHEQSNDIVPISDVTQAIQDHAKVVADATSSSAPILIPLPTTNASGTDTILVASSTLADIAGATTTSSTTQTNLSALVASVKDASTQAFTQQKAKDQVDAASALSAASSTASGDTSSTPATTTSSTPAGDSTTSTSSTPAAPPPPSP